MRKKYPRYILAIEKNGEIRTYWKINKHKKGNRVFVYQKMGEKFIKNPSICSEKGLDRNLLYPSDYKEISREEFALML